MVENFEIYCDHVWACKNKTTGSMIKFLVPEESWGSIDSKYAKFFEENSRKVPRKFQETSGIFQENQILKFQNHDNVVRQSGFDPSEPRNYAESTDLIEKEKRYWAIFKKMFQKKIGHFFVKILTFFEKIWGSSFLSSGFPEVFLRLSQIFFEEMCTARALLYNEHKNLIIP